MAAKFIEFWREIIVFLIFDMNRMTMKHAFAALVMTVLASVTLTSCYEDPGPGTAEIQVVNISDQVQSGGFVKLFCTENDCDVVREGQTNSVGLYTQEFELPVVLRVRAVRYDTTVTVIGLPPNQTEQISVDSLCGEGFIQVENDEVTSERITIVECN